MKSAVFGCLWILALLPVPAAGANDKTITKVVKLLQSMLDKSKADGDNDREVYAKYKCYCDNNEDEKTKAIQELTQQIALLESSISNTLAENAQLSSEVAQLEADMAANVAARANAESIRNQSSEAFQAEESDLSQAITQMEAAIQVLAEVGADQTASVGEDHKRFMAGRNTSILLKLGVQVKTALSAASAFLKPAQRKTVDMLLQQPFTGTYTSQSGEVIGILKDMKGTFELNLETARSNEASEEAAFQKYVATMLASWQEMDTLYTSKQNTLSANDAKISTERQQLTEAQTQLTDAETFLASLKTNCDAKAKEYSERKVLRANEEAAIAEAIAILNSDAAFETFGSVSATSTGSTGPKSFLQISRGRRGQVDGGLRQRLSQILAKVRSGRIAKLRAMVADISNPFETVFTEIEKIKKTIADEAAADKTNLDWCKAERGRTNADIGKKDGEILGLENDIQQLELTINDEKTGLKVQIADTKESLVQNHAAQGEQTTLRKEQNVAYVRDIKEVVEAKDLLTKAITVLSAYYDALAKRMEGQTSLIQEEPEQGPWSGGYSGQSTKATDAVSMLTYILEETKKEEAAAHKDELLAQHAFEDSMATLKTDQATLELSLVGLEDQLATAELNLARKHEELTDAEESKAALHKYLDQIKPGCDFITLNYQNREANRASEVAALDNAITLLKASAAYTNYANATRVAGYGACTDPCVADEAAAACQACLAGVSVPGYCASHPLTPGC